MDKQRLSVDFSANSAHARYLSMHHHSVVMKDK